MVRQIELIPIVIIIMEFVRTNFLRRFKGSKAFLLQINWSLIAKSLILFAHTVAAKNQKSYSEL